MMTQTDIDEAAEDVRYWEKRYAEDLLLSDECSEHALGQLEEAQALLALRRIDFRLDHFLLPRDQAAQWQWIDDHES